MPEQNEVAQAVTWLDEQRKQDRDALEKLQQQVERFGLLLKDLLPQLDRLDGEARQAAAVRARLSRLEEQVRLTQEQTADLMERSQDQAQALDRAMIRQQSDLEREHKTLAESVIQVTELYRREESLRGQMSTLGDEMKRYVTNLASLGMRIERAEEEVERVAQRMLGAEDFRKKVEPELQALRRSQEVVQSEFSRVQQLQQAADLRWNREIAEWRQQMEEWARLLEDQGKTLQQMARELAIVKANIEQIEGQLAEHGEHVDAALVDVRRIENSQELDRQEIARQLTALDALRRRIDDQAGQIRQMEERGTTMSGDIRDVQNRADDARKRCEELLARLVQMEQRQRERGEQAEALQGQLSSLRYDVEGQVRRLDEILQQQRQWSQEQFAQRQRLAERQLRRQLAEIEQELREAKEQSPRSSDAAAE
ncbi:MAG: hypothetical protein M1380_11890 [Chloroflexi bacterium]|nr:hypothetical protein [Chloroflexota bacterium]MCL5025424.1 hypothetical protein [Chloroflexota bacterium]